MSAHTHMGELATVLAMAFVLTNPLAQLSAQEAQKDSSKWSLISIKSGASDTDIELHSAKSGMTRMKAAHFVCTVQKKDGLASQLGLAAFAGRNAGEVWLVRESDAYFEHEGRVFGVSSTVGGSMHLDQGFLVPQDLSGGRFRAADEVGKFINQRVFYETFDDLLFLRDALGHSFFLDKPGSAHPGKVQVETVSVTKDELHLSLVDQAKTARAEVVIDLRTRGLIKSSRTEIQRAPKN